MKLSRWLVSVLACGSVAAILLAAAWWWIAWPPRTARAFVQLIAQGRFQDAEQLSVRSYSNRSVIVTPPADMDLSRWDASGIYLVPRSWTDVLAGRQRFRIARLDFKSPALHYVDLGRRPFSSVSMAGIGWLEFGSVRGTVVQDDWILVYHDPQVPGFRALLPPGMPATAMLPQRHD